ncbi:MAG: tRNA/rRNA methyltransferase (SpoU) [uncultured bacterium (gcode 4)]|uniref:tRNA/rRNA methyltransferase (SpoU) n=1 Tax=uncultured bacterium (gcode 4) TaxID=1234023 RepID=K1XY99_9BACT|nr:MAG: tRNA/rRNA methyltransferase (SpoU) [uncultured bacterium (gcode 4)]
MKILLLNNIRSILNVGALFRTCDGAGFDRIILTGFTPTPPRKELSKTAIGAENFVAWEYYKNPLEYIRDLREKGYTIFVLEQTPESIDFHSIASMEHENICLVLGNEIEGVQKELINIAHHCIEIPMLGQKQSLNVATAWGICMYQFL